MIEKIFQKIQQIFQIFQNMFKTLTQTVPNRRCSFFYYLPIYHLLIITIPELEFLAVPNSDLLVV